MSNPLTSKSVPPPAIDFRGSYQIPCKYCKKPGKTCERIGMTMMPYNPADFEDLLNRGFIRNGMRAYQNDNFVTCCPQFHIRFDATKLKLSPQQRNVLNKWERYMSPQNDKKKSQNTPKRDYTLLTQQLQEIVTTFIQSEDIPSKNPKFYLSQKQAKNGAVASTGIGIQLTNALGSSGTDLSEKLVAKFEVAIKNFPEIVKMDVSKSGLITFYEKSEPKTKPISPKSGTSKLTPEEKAAKKKLKKEKKAHIKNTKKYSKSLVLKISPSIFVKEEFDLYKKYQIKVHKEEADKITEEVYKAGLVETALIPTKVPAWKDSPCSLELGSQHIQYILDGKLIAVSVVDVLPHGMSSIYHFYDPDFSFLNLGTFSVIQEAYLVDLHSKWTPDFKYYNIGAYIHKNKKMNWKATFSPCELLCGQSWKWIPFETCKPLLDKGLIFFAEKVEIKKPMVKMIDHSKFVHYHVTCDGCKKSEFTGIRYKCDQCSNFDFCGECWGKRSSLHDIKHTFTPIYADDEGDDIHVFYTQKLTKLKKLERIIPLTKSGRAAVDLFIKSVGEDLSKKIVYFLADSDFGLNDEKQQTPEKKEDSGKTLKQPEVKKEEAISPIPFTVPLDETKPTTRIQFLLNDGTKVVQKFNVAHPVEYLYKFVDSKLPFKTYDLVISNNKKVLVEKEKTIADMSLQNASVLQVKK